MNIVYTSIYQYKCCIYQYILVYTSYPVTEFGGGHCDAAMLDASQPPVERTKCTVFLNTSVYTVLSCVKHAIYLFILVCTRLCLKCLFSIGWQSRFGWICSSWHQPLKTQQTRVCTGSCSPFDSARWGCSTSVVGVYLQDSPPCPALAAYKVGWVDRGEHAGGAWVSR